MFRLIVLACQLVTCVFLCSCTPDNSNAPQENNDQSSLRILFIGNSHTTNHNVPGLVQKLIEAESAKSDVGKVTTKVTSIAFLEKQSADSDAARDISLKKWDVVVLQGQKISVSGKSNYSTKGAETIANLAIQSGAKVLWFSEWSWLDEKKDATARIQGVYEDIQKNVKGKTELVPVGLAWKAFIAENKNVKLHASDGNHANQTGALLAAFVLYQTITGKDCEKLPAISLQDVDTKLQARLKKIASQTVLQQNAIRQVLELDQQLGSDRNNECRKIPLHETIQNYVKGMRKIDFEKCPKPFREAFANHIEAWNDSITFFEDYSDLRGEMHVLFKQIKSKSDSAKAAVDKIEGKIWGTWDQVVASKFASIEQDQHHNLHPSVSPDGKRIVFDSTRDGDWEIYSMKIDGSNQTRLTKSKGRDAHPFWSRDGKKIVFQSPRNGKNDRDVDIYTMDSDGSNVVRLTNMKGFCGVPAWSPDGKKIVFQHSEQIGVSSWNIFIMDKDGNNLKKLTSTDANDQVPNWSPDGKRIIFHSDKSGRNQLYTMKPDGSDVQQLTDHESNNQSAAFSPDGTKIAFKSDRNGNTREIYVMNIDGTQLKQLTSQTNAHGIPNWTPDGKQIVYQSAKSGKTAIYLMDLESRQTSRLTQN